LIAIVPARSGSKGLPGKNVKLLLGKPMIAYTIEAARQAEYVDEIIISTDDQNIADVAVEYGATCPFLRPAELAADDSRAIDTYMYTIDRLNGERGYQIKDFVVLQATSPLRSGDDIDNAISTFRAHNADSVISYVEAPHPVYWHKYIDENGRFENIFDDQLSNRQQYRKSYYPNGAIYVFKYALLESKSYYSDRSYAYVMPRQRSVDVDTIEDFDYAEFLLEREKGA